MFFRILPLLCLLCVSAGCVDLGGLSFRREPLRETVVYGESGAKILLLEIQGVITGSETPGLFGSREGTVPRVREQLKRAEAAKVVGVLLRVDTPGGSASASELIYRELLAFKQRTKVPVVAHFMGTATSGGYYVAMAADELRAYPTTITGSIGVISAGVNYSGLMEKIGLANQTITSGEFKDSGSPYREMRAEERVQLQSIIDDLYLRFREVVEAGRPKLEAANIAELADGRIYSARQALASGLIDGIGDIEASIERLEKLAGIESSRVVSYHRPSEWRNNLYTQAPSGPGGATVIQLDLRPLLAGVPTPGFHYLWVPNLD